ncbi:MAG: molybdopterin synthase sulfur carrier subunit [Planctomycetota bacterium]|nr:molybdopterin synthase sulfur carrier subunit [Planctomycetota bacterium]
MTEPAPADRTFRLRLHAMLQDAAGTSVTEIRFPVAEIPEEGITALDVFERAALVHPSLADWASVVAFAVGDDLVSPRSPLREDVRQLDALPPVSGG